MSKPTKKIRVKKSDIGRWVTVQFTDVGRRDGLLTHVSPNGKWVEIFEPFEGKVVIETRYILDMRDHVKPA